MIKTKNTQIKEVKFIKSGVGASGKSWDLFNLIDVDGDRYTSFQREPYESLMNKHEPIVLTFNEEQNGKFTNRTIVAPQKNQSGGITVAKWPQQGVQVNSEALNPPIGLNAWDVLFKRLDKMEKSIDFLVEERKTFGALPSLNDLPVKELPDKNPLE